MVKITQQSRVNGRKNINQLDEDFKRRKSFLKKQREKMLQTEELFFSQQVGKHFKSRTLTRFFKILSYKQNSPYCDCGTFDIDFFDLKDKIEHKNKQTTCYNVFGHSFMTQKITRSEYYNTLNKKENGKNKKNDQHTQTT